MKSLKVIIFLFGFFGIATFSHAQLYTGEVQVIQGIPGKVGINTSTPSTTLEVNGSLKVTGTAEFGSVNSGGSPVTTGGSFFVGGSSGSFYPVRFQSLTPGHSSSGELTIYRSSVHGDGSWKGTFTFTIRFHPTNWGHFGNQYEMLSYQTGDGSPYNDPVGNVADGSEAGGGKDLIIWLRGGATYEWRGTQVLAGWTLVNGNSAGGSITDSSGVSRAPTGSQSGLIANAKNRLYLPYQGVRATNFISNTTTYADFVFEDSYQLMPLEELETYIQKHNHLPEIPTEKEAMENGINLAEMNVKLLQKVEELTLYMIELKKQNDLLHQRIEKLETATLKK